MREQKTKHSAQYKEKPFKVASVMNCFNTEFMSSKAIIQAVIVSYPHECL